MRRGAARAEATPQVIDYAGGDGSGLGTAVAAERGLSPGSTSGMSGWV
jgi:hypothetical protein